MCGSKPNVDNSVQIQMQEDARRARAEEEARQGRIREGNATIDAQFAGFDDNFFNNYRDTQLRFQQPQLDRQFGDAQDELTFALARAGTLNSSMAGDRQARLQTEYDTQRASLLAGAEGAAADLRGQINNEKSSLVSLLNATGDSQRASNEALSRSQQLFRRQPTVSNLPDLFAGVTSGIGAYQGGVNQRQAYDTYFGARPASGGNSRVVR